MINNEGQSSPGTIGFDVGLETVQAIILAGGKGTRLRSVVNDRPKPMAEISGKPFLELQIEKIKSYGITNFIFCLGYLHENIQQYFNDGRRWGVNIEYSIEKTPLGTGGALKLAERFVRDTFLVFNGDSYLDVDLKSLIAFHDKKKIADPAYLGAMVLTEVSDARQFGSVKINASKKVLCFHEKASDTGVSNIVSAGVYIFGPTFLNFIPGGKTVSLENEIFPEVVNSSGNIYGFFANSFFMDIGTPYGYRAFQEYVKEVHHDYSK